MTPVVQVRFALAGAIAVLATLPLASGAGAANGQADVFVTARTALLREQPSPRAPVLARLAMGSRLRLVGRRRGYLQAETVAGVVAFSDPPSHHASATGYLAPETAAVFVRDQRAPTELLAVARALAPNPSYRTLAAALLLCATQQLRGRGISDPEAELLLGETAEDLAADGAKFPEGLEMAAAPAADGGPSRSVYVGPAFERAFEAVRRGSDAESGTRERAVAGILRARFRGTERALVPLLNQTAAWLGLVEEAREPTVVSKAADRLGESAMAASRLLLAAGRLDQLKLLRCRLAEAAQLVAKRLPGEVDGRRLASRALIIAAMQGDGSSPFPQTSTARVRQEVVEVSIEGALGHLQLTVTRRRDGRITRKILTKVTPILPVPGSLSLSPDARAVVWLEVAAPSRIVAMLAPLEADEPAREIDYLAGGRALRERRLGHFLTRLLGFSPRGDRLGFSIVAWNDTPATPCLFLVTTRDGRLIRETGGTRRNAQRFRRALDRK
jgi:hypothetical protein